jgi:hypothetical protein
MTEGVKITQLRLPAILYEAVRERAHEWLREQARERGISRNDVVQELINEKMSSKGDLRT